MACDTTTASTTGLLKPPTLMATLDPGGEGVDGNGDDGDDGGVMVEPPQWSEDAVSTFEGLDLDLLPRLIDGAAPGPVGEISRDMIQALNLPECLGGVPVFHGGVVHQVEHVG